MSSEARLMSILRAPVISEKSTAASEKSVVTFKVLPDATKEEIKAAVEKIFGVEVVGVRTLNLVVRLVVLFMVWASAMTGRRLM